MSKYVDEIYMVTIECYKCHITFGVPQEFDKEKLEDHSSFYCPAGHGQVYSGKTQEQKLRTQLEQKERELNNQISRTNNAESQRDRVAKSYTKIRDRVKNGVCPCCTRSFQNLMEHMKNEHPEFGDNELLKALRETYGLTQTALAEEINVPPSYISTYEKWGTCPAWAETEITQWVANQ